MPQISQIGEVYASQLFWLAIFFGTQSLLAYAIFGWFADIFHAAGYSPHTSGILLSVITGVTIPLSFVVAHITARLTSQAPLLLTLVACYVIGFGGLIVAPGPGAWAWAVLVGIGTCTFPMILTLIGLRARTAEGTAALSGFTQSVGYLLAAAGPFGVGVLHSISGGWTLPLIALTLVLVPLTASGLGVSRERYVEDELA